MKKFGKVLMVIGICMFFVFPIYQAVYFEIEGSTFVSPYTAGTKVYGDNPLFRNILGIKVVSNYPTGGDVWEWEYTLYITPSWMQHLVPQKVLWVWTDRNENATSSPWWQIVTVIVLRTLVKFIIPGIFFIPGWLLKNKK